MTEQKCSRCHDLERILLAHHAMVNWSAYVDRMRRQPGSGINVADGKIIVGCLNYIKARQQDAAAMNSLAARPPSSPCLDSTFRPCLDPLTALESW